MDNIIIAYTSKEWFIIVYGTLAMFSIIWICSKFDIIIPFVWKYTFGLMFRPLVYLWKDNKKDVYGNEVEIGPVKNFFCVLFSVVMTIGFFTMILSLPLYWVTGEEEGCRIIGQIGMGVFFGMGLLDTIINGAGGGGFNGDAGSDMGGC